MSSDWRHPDLHICESSIHGQGWFSKKPILKNEIVFVFGGRPFIQNLKELRNKPFQEKDSFYRSVIHLSDDFYLKASDNPYRTPESRLINHSCDPNLIMEGHVVARAFRNIPSAQELYLDYSTMGHPEDEHIIIEKCACGTAFCRKQIRSRDWKSPALQKKYGVHFSFALLKKIRGLF